MLHKYLDEAITLANRSTIRTHGTGAVIVASSGRVSTGWSHRSEWSLVSYRSIHAEIHALLRCDRSKLKGATIYVATVRKKSDNIGLGRPCSYCLATIHSVGIKRVVFTVEGDVYDVLEVGN